MYVVHTLIARSTYDDTTGTGERSEGLVAGRIAVVRTIVRTKTEVDHTRLAHALGVIEDVLHCIGDACAGHIGGDEHDIGLRCYALITGCLVGTGCDTEHVTAVIGGGQVILLGYDTGGILVFGTISITGGTCTGLALIPISLDTILLAVTTVVVDVAQFDTVIHDTHDNTCTTVLACGSRKFVTLIDIGSLTGIVHQFLDGIAHLYVFHVVEFCNSTYLVDGNGHGDKCPGKIGIDGTTEFFNFGQHILILHLDECTYGLGLFTSERFQHLGIVAVEQQQFGVRRQLLRESRCAQHRQGCEQ